MRPRENLKAVESHFKFGDNWASYAQGIDDEALVEAERGLLRLISRADLEGRTFLDIGCGSGIHALAAARLGAKRVLAVDIDPRSVETARALLSAQAPHANWSAQTLSIFAMEPGALGTFDVVYSWGVLHHTGDMDTALSRAAALVAPGGLFAFALYRTTRLDALWVREKRWYSSASPRAQAWARAFYVGAFRLGLLATGRRFTDYCARRKTERGMDFDHDVHDWLGGYPYETASVEQVARLMRELGFAQVRSFARTRREFGLFGSGCDEYVYRRG